MFLTGTMPTVTAAAFADAPITARTAAEIKNNKVKFNLREVIILKSLGDARVENEDIEFKGRNCPWYK